MRVTVSFFRKYAGDTLLKITIMKKNYNQPMVETTIMMACGQALCASDSGNVDLGGGGGSGIDPD